VVASLLKSLVMLKTFILYSVRMVFDLTKSKEVEIGNEKMSQMIIKEKLLERVVMKRWAHMSVSSREKNNTKRNLAERPLSPRQDTDSL